MAVHSHRRSSANGVVRSSLCCAASRPKPRDAGRATVGLPRWLTVDQSTLASTGRSWPLPRPQGRQAAGRPCLGIQAHRRPVALGRLVGDTSARASWVSNSKRSPDAWARSTRRAPVNAAYTRGCASTRILNCLDVTDRGPLQAGQPSAVLD